MTLGRPMNILVACEESQAVAIEARNLGHNAFSCDIIDQSGGHPEWHIKQDVLPLLNGNCEFTTQDGTIHRIDGKWDMIIAFPPCTFLTNTGNRWFDVLRYGKAAQTRWNERCKAIVFFLRFVFSDCDKIVVENPIGCMSTLFRKPDQIVHPYYFAETENDENCERKATCLWLKGVDPLRYEIKFQPRVISYKNGKGTDSPWHTETIGLPPVERAKARSKTFPGIARAMIEQWAGDEITTKIAEYMTVQNDKSPDNPLLARLYRHNLHPEDLAEATGYSLRYIFSVLTGKHNTPYAVAKLNRAIDIVLKSRK